MPLDFPSSPTVGQQYLNWTWNGVAWVVTPGPPLASLAQFAQNSGRNYLDNALFNIQQRGAGPFTANGYSADRWKIVSSGDTISFAVIPLTDAQRTQIGDESAVWGLQNSFTGTSAASSFNSVCQLIEKVRRLAGKTITISFFASANTPLSLGVAIQQNFGSGGSPSAIAVVNGQAASVGTSFARYQLTFSIPSAVGKTFGTNGDDFTQIYFFYSASTTQTGFAGIGVQTGVITLWGVQVEVGSQATPLEKLVPEVDLARCQRFYCVGYISLGGGGPATASIIMSNRLPVTMRATPTGNGQASTSLNNSGAVVSCPDSGSVQLQYSLTSSTAGGLWVGNFSATADL